MHSCSQGCQEVAPGAELMELSCGNTESIKDPYWTSRENSLELIEVSSINKVSLV
jgi:hypothetical protein